MLACKSKIRKIGNGKGLLLNAEICDALHLNLDTEIELHLEDGALVILPVTPTLDDLMQSIPEGETFSEYSVGQAMGDEI